MRKIIAAALVMAGLSAPADACVLLRDVDYSVLYRSDAIVRAKVVGYLSRPEAHDALFDLEVVAVVEGAYRGPPVIKARWERKYTPAPQIWDGYTSVIVGLRFDGSGGAQIVRESCGFDGIVEDTPDDLKILRSQAPGT